MTISNVGVLARKELLELIRETEFISDEDNYFISNANDNYSHDSHVQQTSIDLHIGGVCIPGRKDSEDGGLFYPCDCFDLKPGDTAIIRTLEKIDMPLDIGGICFSPSRIALKGGLVINMGHVDPGYSGHLHFTIINMGNSPLSLNKKNIICTFLLFRVAETCDKYGDEIFIEKKYKSTVKNIPKALSDSLPKLSDDFLNITKKAEGIGEKYLTKAKWLSFVVACIFVIPSVAPGIMGLYKNQNETAISTLNESVRLLESSINIQAREIIQVDKCYYNKMKLYEKQVESLRAENESFRVMIKQMDSKIIEISDKINKDLKPKLVKKIDETHKYNQ